MKQRMQRFMAGRYGADQLGQLYLGVSMVLLVVSLFSRWNIFYAFAPMKSPPGMRFTIHL